MCGHIVGRDVVPHRTTVLHKYNIQHEVKQYKPTHTTKLLSALTIHKVVTYT